MSKCEDCDRDMKKAETCIMKYIFINNKKMKRVIDYFDIGEKCHDCRIINKKGNIHHFGCDMERCPNCEGQLISCDCKKGIITQ